MNAHPANADRPPYIVRLIRARPRLFVAGVLAVGVMGVLPGTLRLATRMLIAWDAGVMLNLVLVYRLVTRASIDYIRARAPVEDESQIGILISTVAAALASLGAIVVELGTSANAGSGRHPANLLLAVLTILLSWAFTHTIFALHYAHEFYSDGGTGSGLMFPGGGDPDYWDFVYFSFVIGMTSQVSDVAVCSRSIRRTVAAHGVVAFVFNAALLALTVNIAASVI